MISIFKTNIENNSQIEKISKQLDGLIGRFNWNFDLEDCDRILRVESDNSFTVEILDILKSKGFVAIELF